MFIFATFLQLNNLTLVCFSEILTNKQDLPNALTATTLVEHLGLTNLKNTWHIQQMCATTGDGLNEGVKQMAKNGGGVQEKQEKVVENFAVVKRLVNTPCQCL